MANNSEPKHPFLVATIIIGIIAICVTVFVFASVVSLPTSEPTPTATQPTSLPSRQYQPEAIPLLTYTPDPARTVTVTPTDRPAPALTATPTLPYVPPIGKPLPDLIIASIGDPVCIHDVYEEIPRSYLTLKIIVRNIGDASTHTFGGFDTGAYILLGQSFYSLDEWGDTYGGVIGLPNMTISNLDPNWDRTFTLAIDLNEITNFGIKAVANSGENPIPETDRENNTLIKYFSVYCY